MRLRDLFSFSRSRSQNRKAASPAEDLSLQSPAAQNCPTPQECHRPNITPNQGTERPLLSKAQPFGEAAPSLVCYLQNEFNLWASARSRLPDKDKKTISKFVPINEIGTTSMPSALLQAVHAKREICEKNHWSFQYKGRTIRLKDAADRVLLCMEKFKAVGDIAVNADPIHAGLPWAGIRLLLQAAVSKREQMEALLRGLNRVLHILYRCQLYQSLFQPERGTDQASRHLRRTLVDLYILILRFLAKALRVYENNSLGRAIAACWSSDDIQMFERECQGLETRAEIEAQNCERFLNSAERAMTAKMRKDLSKLSKLSDISDSLDHVDFLATEMWGKLQEEEMGTILRWVSEIPHEDDHKAARNGRTPGTGGWLFEHHKYRAWQSSERSEVFWIHGIPGAGKTKLISNVIDKLLDQRPDGALAFFLCDGRISSRREPKNILQSFVKQLARSPQNDVIQQVLIDVYRSAQRSGWASAELSLEESEDLILKLIVAYPRTILVLDALDEVHEARRGDLIRALDRLTSKAKNLKVLICSRRDDDIMQNLEKKTNLGIGAADNQADIRKFILERLEKAQTERRRPMSDNLRNDIVETLLKRSQGMFQWVALQIDQILRLQLEEDIRNQLGRLPSDLERTYDDIFDTIRNSEGSKPDIAVRAFQWILFSFEPLSSESLVMFVGRNLENGATKHLDLDIYTVLDACCNLLVVDTSSSMCRFSHLSVQDYLEGHFYSTDTSTICAQAELASITIQCLLQTNHIHKSEDMLAQVPSLQYAAKFWHHHTRAAFKTSGDPCEKDAQTKQLVCDLFERQDKFNLWICLYDPDVLGNPILSAQNIPSPIYYSSLCGFCEPTKRLLEKGLDVNIPGGRHGRPLIAASWEGHYSLVEQLLEGGADVNSQGGNYGTALQAASVWGHEAVVSLLLEKGADVNCNCGHYGFALEAAAFGGHLSISEKLLQYGADVDAKGGDFGTALQAASSNGKEKLVKLLLDPGASVNIQNGRHGNALQAALWAGHIEIADLLRVHGALALATPVSLDWDRDFSFRVC